MNAIQRIENGEAAVSIRTAGFSELIANLHMLCGHRRSHGCFFIVHARLEKQPRHGVERNRSSADNKHISIEADSPFDGRRRDEGGSLNNGHGNAFQAAE